MKLTYKFLPLGLLLPTIGGICLTSINKEDSHATTQSVTSQEIISPRNISDMTLNFTVANSTLAKAWLKEYKNSDIRSLVEFLTTKVNEFIKIFKHTIDIREIDTISYNLIDDNQFRISIKLNDGHVFAKMNQ